MRVEKELEKKLAEQHKALPRPELPPARPRRKPLIRKGTEPGTVIIAKSGEFGGPEFELLMDGIGEAFEMFTKDVIAPLQKRIAELEASPTKYVGVWTSGTEYAPRSMVSWSGSIWHANEGDHREARHGCRMDARLQAWPRREGRQAMTKPTPFDYEVHDHVVALHEEGKARGDTDEQIAAATKAYLGSTYVRYQIELERQQQHGDNRAKLTVIQGGKE